MKTNPIGITKKARWLRAGALWLCLLSGMFVIVLAARPGVRVSFAQAPQQAAGAQDDAKRTQGASAQAPELQAKHEPPASAMDERKKLIADESASLLSLANSLKAEMDKTTKDTLSVTVVRKAGEIEQLARKMRAK